MSKLFLSLTLFFFLGNLYAQSYWKEDNTKRQISTDKTYKYYTLDKQAFSRALHQNSSRSRNNYSIIELPDGETITSYKVKKTAILSDELAQRYPQIETYSGYSLENPSKSVSFTWHSSSCRLMTRKFSGLISRCMIPRSCNATNGSDGPRQQTAANRLCSLFKQQRWSRGASPWKTKPLHNQERG